MAKQQVVQLPKSYDEAKRRLNGRKIVFLPMPDGRTIIDYGKLITLHKTGNCIIVIDGHRRVVTYWEDGAVDFED